MPVGTNGFVGQRLTEAREARGLTISELAEKLDRIVSVAALSQYEGNASTPRAEILEQLAKNLDVPQFFFLKPVGTLSEDTLFWRSLISAAKSTRIQARRRFTWLKEITNYLREYVDFPQLNLPSPRTLGVPTDPRRLDTLQLEQIANKCRSYWGLGNAPIGNLTFLLENNGVVITRAKLGTEKLDAFSHFSVIENIPYIFLSNDKNSAVRSRFDAAHELAHIILHRTVTDDQMKDREFYNEIERQAHYFAAAFLMPRESFSRDVKYITLDSFRVLKERWRVSIAAIIVRCKQLDKITETQEQRLWINYTRRGWRKREPLDEQLPLEKPHLLKHSFELLIDERIKTRSQILSELMLPRADIEELAGLPKDYLSVEAMQIKLTPKLKIKRQ